jgi:hypothetical protein
MSRVSVSKPHSTAKAPQGDRGEVSPVASEIARPSGPAAAVVLAAGLGSFALGLLSVLTALSSSVSSVLTLSERTGDLSGVTTAAAAVFFTVWAVLARAWRHADPSLIRVSAAAAVLIALGLLGTFPPFFNLIGGERDAGRGVDGAFGAGSSSPRAKTGGSAAAFALVFEVRARRSRS